MKNKTQTETQNTFSGLRNGPTGNLAIIAGVTALLGSMVDARAVLLNSTAVRDATPTAVVQPGAVVGNLLSNYGPSIGGADAFYGTLETVVVQRSGAAVIDGQAFVAGGLDFWVQVRMDFDLIPPSSNPGADNSRITYSPFDPLAPGFLSAEFLVGGVVPGGVLGFSGLANGTQAPVTVQASGTNVIAWDWTGTAPGPVSIDNSMTSAAPNSFWLVLHTNDTLFGPIGAGILDGGVAPAQTLAPVPEPAASLFGLGIIGLLGFVRRGRGQRST